MPSCRRAREQSERGLRLRSVPHAGYSSSGTARQRYKLPALSGPSGAARVRCPHHRVSLDRHILPTVKHQPGPASLQRGELPRCTAR